MNININPNAGSGNIKNKLTPGSRKGGEFYSITDKLTKAVKTAAGYAKPIFKDEAVEKTEAVEEKSGSKGINDAKGFSSGMESVPGPSAAVISKIVGQLSRRGTKFLKKSMIPFYDGKEMSADDAAKVLSGSDDSAKAKLLVKTGEGDPVPLTKGSELMELAVFKDLSDEQLANAGVVDFLKYVEQTGVTLNSKGREDIGGYGAYRLTSTGWDAAGVEPQAVDLMREGITIMTIDSQNGFDGKQAKKDLDEAWEAYDTLEKFEKEDYQKLKYLKTVDRPLFNMSFMEKYSSFDKMDRYCDKAITKYSIISKKARTRAEFEDVVKVLENEDTVQYNNSNYSEFSVEEIKLVMDGKRSSASPAEKLETISTLGKLFNRKSYWDNERYFVDSSFEYLDKKAKDNADLKKLTGMYIKTYRSLHTSWRFVRDNSANEVRKATEAFDFITGELGGDPKKTKAFQGILSSGKDIDECKEMYHIIEPQIGMETFDDRAEAAAILGETKNFQTNFLNVIENHKSGENVAEWAKFMRHLEKTFDEKLSGGRKVFVDAKKIALDNKASADDCSYVASHFYTSVEVFSNAMKLLKAPVKGEGFRTRKDILVELRSSQNHSSTGSVHKSDSRCEEDAVGDYNVIAANIGRGEGLRGAADRFQMLRDTFNGNRYPKEVRSLYTELTREIERSDGKVSKGTIKRIVDNTDYIKASDEQLTKVEKFINGRKNSGLKDFIPNPNEEAADKKEIINDDKTVVIGGVELKKNR